jgi:hypothetical protein
VVHRKVRHALNPGHVIGGLKSVDIPASEETRSYPIGPDPKTWQGSWNTMTDPAPLATHVCSANAHQYHQAESSPFSIDPLLYYSGYRADTNGVDRLVSGTPPPDEIISVLLPEIQNLCCT